MPAFARQPGRQVRRGVKRRAGVGCWGHDLGLLGVWGAASAMVSDSRRDFIEKRYVELKKANPDLPILIRECSDVQPKLWARYGERGTPGVWGSGSRWEERGAKGSRSPKICRYRT